MTSVRDGDIFAGRYRVENVIGEGGHGVVFAAHDMEKGQRVAVKLLKRAATDDTSAERFFREARAAQKIRGDGVAHVFAVERLDDGDLYMAMEYLEGHDLRHELADTGPLGVPDAVVCAIQACDVLGRAHAIGIIHRDVKPANLFSVERTDGRRHIKVLDFGIARSLDPTDHSLTQSPQMMGSPLYMAPEQILDGRSVDERTDIWGLGATLFEMLAGKPPFGGGTILQLLLRVRESEPDDLRKLRPSVPSGLQQVVLRCLEKDREERYADMAALASALAPFALSGTGTGAEVSIGDAPTVALQNRPTSNPPFSHTSPMNVLLPGAVPAAVNEPRPRAQSVAPPPPPSVVSSLPSYPVPASYPPPGSFPPPAAGVRSLPPPPSRAPLIIVIVAFVVLGVVAAAFVQRSRTSALPSRTGGAPSAEKRTPRGVLD